MNTITMNNTDPKSRRTRARSYTSMGRPHTPKFMPMPTFKLEVIDEGDVERRQAEVATVVPGSDAVKDQSDDTPSQKSV